MGFWDRLAERVKPTESLETIEDPKFIVRAFSAGLWGGIAQTLVSIALWVGFDEPAAAWAGTGLLLAYLVAWSWFLATGGVLGSVVIVVTAGVTTTVVVHVALGGFGYSGGIVLYGIAFVMVAALLAGRALALPIAVLTMSAGVVLLLLETTLRESRTPPDPTMSTIFFVMVLLGSINVLGPLIVFFMDRLHYERQRAERLLLNVLPEQVATELKEEGRTTARHFDSISVLFADTVGFTPLASGLDPEEVVTILNEVFTYFDGLADKYDVEKIRTIGDAYMVASGLPVPRSDHAHALAAMSLDMLRYAESSPLEFRIGINSGPVVAGVIGTRKFQYDIWGDTVNTASRMESHGEAGRVQISESTHELIQDDFATAPRGQVEIKGKGLLDTWWLEPRAAG